MKVFIHTLGCKVNQYESQAMAELFEKQGHAVVIQPEQAEVFVVNSCTVTAESDKKTKKTIRRFRGLNPNSIVIVTGCMTQAFPSQASSLDADIIIGNKGYSRLPLLLNEFVKTHKRIVAIQPHLSDDKFEASEISQFNERTRAYLKIEDGCNRFCSYCIIPTARGRVRSKPIDCIRQEAGMLAKAGFCEIVLVGINLSAFGRDIGAELCDAVSAINDIDGIKRIRLGSLEPDQISDKTLDFLSHCEKFCPQFHLSLQSGCDKTLAAMNRHYDTAFYYELITRIRSKFDVPSITTDVMVGFAGETELDFEQSANFVKKAGLARAHVFAYSRRTGTKADKMALQVDESTKAERSRKMIEICDAAALAFHKSQVGKTFEVLFETFNNGGYYEGYTKNYTKVKVKTPLDVQNKIMNVTITDAFSSYCLGEIEQ